MTIDDLFSKSVSSNAVTTLSKKTDDSLFPSNVIVCDDMQQYIDFTNKHKNEYEIVFDIGYAVSRKNVEESEEVLSDVREFVVNFAQFCELRLKCPIAYFSMPFKPAAAGTEMSSIYISTFMNVHFSIHKLLDILADVRSLQQRLLRQAKHVMTFDIVSSRGPTAPLSGHSMTIQKTKKLDDYRTAEWISGRPLNLDAESNFVQRVYEQKYASDEFLKDRSLRTNDFRWTIESITDDLKMSEIFGNDEKMIYREVEKWMCKARLWKLEYRHDKNTTL